MGNKIDVDPPEKHSLLDAIRPILPEKLPIPSAGDSIERLFDWLRDELRLISYGEIGLSFIVHDSQVVKYEQKKIIKSALD